MSTPTPEQLAHLIGHADHRALTPAEAAALRAGVADLQRRLAAARIAETRIALAHAVLNGHAPDSDEARMLAHEIREALTMPDPEAKR